MQFDKIIANDIVRHGNRHGNIIKKPKTLCLGNQRHDETS